jgi:integrase
VFRNLPRELPLAEQLLVEVVTSGSKPNTAMRKTCAESARQLAKFAKLTTERIDRLVPQRSIKVVNPRDLPSDEEIVRARDGIEEPGWQYLFGLLAAYGFRPHELLTLDYSEYPEIRTAEHTKTGCRFVKPLYPEWAEDWKLGEVILPVRIRLKENDLKSNQKSGVRISNWFQRNIDFSAYNLRHAYAQRGIRLGIPDAALAYMMGHSLEIHTKVYRAWVDERVYLDGADRALQKSDRPLPPSV